MILFFCIFLFLLLAWLFYGLYDEQYHHHLEKTILQKFISTKVDVVNIPISKNLYIHTLKTVYNPKLPNLLIIHGFGGGIVVWCKRIDELATKFNIFAIDLLGFGLTSKPCYKGITPEDSIKFWIDSIEMWRMAVNIDKFSILGHSLGAFLALNYSLEYPNHVDHLYLATPIGIGGWLWDPNSLIKKMILHFFLGQYGMTPQTILRFFTPFSWFIWKLMKNGHHPDLEPEIWEYLYLNQISPKSGDLAFTRLLTKQGFYTTMNLDKIKINITLIYGDKDYIRHEHAENIVSKSKHVKYFVLQDQNHHIYWNPKFVDLILNQKV